MAATPLPPADFLRECFSYDPDTGRIVWRSRPARHFDSEDTAYAWNRQYAGRQTFISKDHDGYFRGEVRYEGRRYRLRAHRVVFKMFTGRDPEQIDHINGDEGDNRWSNLRETNSNGNMRNRPAMRSHLPKCVFPSGTGKFVAKTYAADGRRKHLGTFASPAEAHAAYVDFVKPFHGEFFNPGKPTPTIWD